MGARVAVAGASGYVGGELLRLLAGHPDVEIVAATGHTRAGTPLAAVHPQLALDLTLSATEPATLTGADLVFLALPHGESAALAAALPAATKAGCYAVATILALAPLIAAGLADPDDVVVVAASGTSGAGRAPQPYLLASEVMGSLSPYKVGVHQHVPEIKRATGARTLSMTPILAPMPRGILATVTARPLPGATAGAVREALAYAGEPFVRLLPDGVWPSTAATLGANSAHLQSTMDSDSGRIIVTCAIDNLGKGAAGQAVQCANLMLGLRETAGLTAHGVAP